MESVLTENMAVFCSRRRCALGGTDLLTNPTRTVMIDLRRIRDDLLALVLFAATVFVGLALFSYNPADPPGTAVYPTGREVTNLCGSAGAKLAHHLFTNLGYGAYFVVVCLISSDGRLFSHIGLDGLITRTVGLAVALLAVCIGLHFLMPDVGHGPVVGSGGYVGAWGRILLAREFATAGSLLLLGSLFTAGMVLSGDVGVLAAFLGAIIHFVTSPWRFMKRVVTARRRWRKDRPAPPPDDEERQHDEIEQEANAGTDRRLVRSPEDEKNDEDNLNEEGDENPVPISFPINAPPKLTPQNERQSPAPRRRRVPPRTDLDEVPVEKELERKTSKAKRIDEELGEEYSPQKAPRNTPKPRVLEAKLDAEKRQPKRTKTKDQPKAPAPETEPRQIKVNAPLAVRDTENQYDQDDDEGEFSQLRAETDFALPPIDILEPAEEFPYERLAKKAQADAEILEKTFRDFGLNVQVVEVDTGPVVTQFELDLEAGLRLNKITALADDLAIALRVPTVRVVAPIPGKNTVGIEVPNEKRTMVRLRELIESAPKERTSKRIPIFVGKDVSGRPMTVDLTKMPHLLIAGRTGTGKSVCLNTLILSILMTRTPEEVKMLMIDPKMVELSPYRRVPHLMHPVITDMKKAEAVLGWAVDKMEERYDLLARCGVRHLDSYNKLSHDEILDRLGLDPEDPEDMLEAEAVPERMPYIVILADEMADMIMTCGKDVEGHIVRLAQKSRAVGIHLVLATQKPTVDVITGLIKSNLPARISFQVSSKSDSRVVLDESGAERLLGNGDMLYLAPGTSNLSRAQGTFVSDDEINAVIDFFSGIEPQYSAEIAQATSEAGTSGGGGLDAIRDRDELYAQACEVVIREGRGSCSLLQRALGIGYGRAARMIDYMAEDGIVGPYNGSKHREVMYTLSQWEEMQSDEPLEVAGV